MLATCWLLFIHSAVQTNSQTKPDYDGLSLQNAVVNMLVKCALNSK